MLLNKISIFIEEKNIVGLFAMNTKIRIWDEDFCKFLESLSALYTKLLLTKVQSSNVHSVSVLSRSVVPSLCEHK